MFRCALIVSTLVLSVVPGLAAEKGVAEKEGKSNFERTREQLEKAQRENKVERPPAAADRGLINNSERQQMQRLETEERNNNRR